MSEYRHDLRLRLRVTTRAIHERLEARTDVEGRLTSIDAYRSFLENLLGIYRPLEDALRALDWSGSGLDFESRRKLDRLTADLIDLGHSAAIIERLPDCLSLPLPLSRAEGLGVLYVIEGATLGGRVILQRIESRLGVNQSWAGHFLYGYGENTGAMWMAFVESLNAAGADAPIASIIEASALATFVAFEEHLAARSQLAA